jgi:hypothetical protein
VPQHDVGSENESALKPFGDEYFQVFFDSEPARDDGVDLSEPDRPYLILQHQFEGDDGGICYIETRDRDAYSGDFRLRRLRDREAETLRSLTTWTKGSSERCAAS